VPGKDIPRIIPLLSKSHKTRCLGATALDLAYLACGSISVFVSPSLSRSFDFGGGWLLVKEAGGLFTDMDGNPIDDIEIGLKKSSPLLASGNRCGLERAVKPEEAGGVSGELLLVLAPAHLKVQFVFLIFAAQFPFLDPQRKCREILVGRLTFALMNHI